MGIKDGQLQQRDAEVQNLTYEITRQQGELQTLRVNETSLSLKTWNSHMKGGEGKVAGELKQLSMESS